MSRRHAIGVEVVGGVGVKTKDITSRFGDNRVVTAGNTVDAEILSEFAASTVFGVIYT